MGILVRFSNIAIFYLITMNKDVSRVLIWWKKNLLRISLLKYRLSHVIFCFFLLCSLLLVDNECEKGGGSWTVVDDDFVDLRITAGTSPSVYFEGGETDKSIDPLVIVVDEAASEDGVDWICCCCCCCWVCWSFSKRIRHQSGAFGSCFWITRTCWPLLTVNSCELRAV